MKTGTDAVELVEFRHKGIRLRGVVERRFKNGNVAVRPSWRHDDQLGWLVLAAVLPLIYTAATSTTPAECPYGASVRNV